MIEMSIDREFRENREFARNLVRPEKIQEIARDLQKYLGFPKKFW